MKHTRCLQQDWDHSGLSGLQLSERGISSVEEYIANCKERLRQKDELLAYLARPDVSGEDKGYARCAYLLRNGKLPFQCRQCFLLPGNCVCGRVAKFTPCTKLVVSMHPDEWGKGSNTGCLAAASLAGAAMLMRGHKEHDEQLQALLEDPAYTCAMLWPGEDALEPQQLLELSQQRGTRIALIALDGTWDCARKMKSRFPPGLLMLRVPPHLALPDAARQRQQQWEEQQQQGQQQHQQQGQPEQPQQQVQLEHPGQQHQPQQQQDAAAEREPCPVPTVDSRGRDAQHATAADAAASSSSSSPRSRSSSADGRSIGASCSASNSSTLGISAKHHHQHFQGQPASLFRPLRKYQGNAAANGRVCTLEAVAGALLALEGDAAMHEGLLHALKLKVDAMRRQKHMAEVYGTTAAYE